MIVVAFFEALRNSSDAMTINRLEAEAPLIEVRTIGNFGSQETVPELEPHEESKASDVQYSFSLCPEFSKL